MNVKIKKIKISSIIFSAFPFMFLIPGVIYCIYLFVSRGSLHLEYNPNFNPSSFFLKNLLIIPISMALLLLGSIVFAFIYNALYAGTSKGIEMELKIKQEEECSKN